MHDFAFVLQHIASTLRINILHVSCPLFCFSSSFILHQNVCGGKGCNAEIKHNASWCNCDQATLTLLNEEAPIKCSTAVAVPTVNLSSLRADYVKVYALRMTV